MSLPFSANEEEPWTVGQIVWTFCFSLILVTSILGNTIVLWIILGNTDNEESH